MSHGAGGLLLFKKITPARIQLTVRKSTWPSPLLKTSCWSSISAFWVSDAPKSSANPGAVLISSVTVAILESDYREIMQQTGAIGAQNNSWNAEIYRGKTQENLSLSPSSPIARSFPFSQVRSKFLGFSTPRRVPGAITGLEGMQ